MEDPVVQLLLVFVALHVIEGAVFIRRSAFVFIGWGRSYGVRSGQTSPIGNAQQAVRFLSPFPPFQVGFVSEIPEWTIGTTAVWPFAFQRPGLPYRPREQEAQTEASFRDAEAEGKVIRSGGRVITKTSSPVSARVRAQEFRRFAQSDEVTRRNHFRDGVAKSHDLDALRERLLCFRNESRFLAVLGPLTLTAAFGSVLGVCYIPTLFGLWPVFLAFTLGFWLVLLIEVWRVHRIFYPEFVGDRVMKVILLAVSLPAAARAKAFVARDLLIGFHPLAIARILLPEAAFRDFAGLVWRDLTFSLSLDVDLTIERGVVRDAHAQLLKDSGLTPEALEAAPESDGASIGYCPRCHALYASLEGECEDCPGQDRVAFASPS